MSVIGDGIMLDGVAGLVRRGFDPEVALDVLGRGMRFAGHLVDEHEAIGWCSTTSGDLVIHMLAASVIVEPQDPQLAAAIVEVARGMSHELVHM